MDKRRRGREKARAKEYGGRKNGMGRKVSPEREGKRETEKIIPISLSLHSLILFKLCLQQRKNYFFIICNLLLLKAYCSISISIK